MLREEGFKGESKGELLRVEGGPRVGVHCLGEGGHAGHSRGGKRLGKLLSEGTIAGGLQPTDEG